MIYISSVIATNAVGLVLLFIIGIMNAWRFREKNMESRILLAMLVIIAISCILDPLIFLSDGHDTIPAFVMNFAGNTLLFLANVLFATCWNLFISNHLEGRLSKIRVYVLLGVVATGTILLIINIFVPIVFKISDSNVYSRGASYFIFMGADILLMLDSVLTYFRVKLHGGILKFFPVWVYFIPIALGMVFQSVFYGISVVWPASAVAYLGIIMSLQNDLVFRDRLTGLYNRYFLDTIHAKYSRMRKAPDVVAMLLDLNHFKAINDGYGHQEGDEALVRAAIILKEAVSGNGVVLRYAGDEFVIILNTQSAKVVAATQKAIHEGFETYNAMGVKPYKLSVSIGMSNVNLKDKSVNEVLDVIDSLMYEEKRFLHDSEWQM